MRPLNRVLTMVAVILAAAALAAFLRARGDSHRLGGATDLGGSLEPLITAFNDFSDRPRLLLILAPACPVCLQGAESVAREVLPERGELEVLVVWMEALPFDITRNPARRVETFAGEARMRQFYDMQQTSGRALREVLAWPPDSLPWSVYLYFPAGVRWQASPPQPAAWFHQREVADPDLFRLGPDLTRALLDSVPATPPGGSVG